MNPSDDQRFKDLTDRLVAMSPEPPPFPEETVVTTPGKASRRSPLLVFAGAAAAVLIAIGIPFVLFNNQEPPVAAPSTSTTTTPSTTTTDPGTSTPSTEPSGPIAQFGTVIYLVADPENSNLGNPALVPFYTFVNAPAGSDDVAVTAATLDLLTNPDLILPDGFANSIPAGVEVLGVRKAEGAPNALIIDMNDKFLDGAGGLLADVTMLNQLVFTATNSFGLGRIDGIDQIQFIVNNQPVTQFGSEGIDLSSSIGREDFQDELNPIIITEPVIFNGDDLPQVVGLANVFEATVSLDIVNNGTVAYTAFTNASCGTGCWGTFEFSLDTPAINADSIIRVYWNSAKDGSPSDVVSIPVNADGYWTFLP
jgi:spore germination protein GerM